MARRTRERPRPKADVGNRAPAGRLFLSYRRAALVLILVFGAARFAKWGASVTDDEAYMLRTYASHPISFIRTHYEVPNNHVLLSMLLHGVDAASPKPLISRLAPIQPLQLPSIAASILTLPLLYVVACQLFNPAVALLAVSVLCVSWWHLIYSHMLRGYSLSAFCGVLSVYLTLRLLRREKRRAAAAAALAATLTISHYLLPSNVEFTLALAVGAAALAAANGKRARGAISYVAAAIGGAGAMTAWLYLPIAAQVFKNMRDKELSWAQSFASTGDRLAQWLAVLGWGAGFRAFWLGAAALGIAAAVRRPRWRPAVILAAAFPLVPLLLSFAEKNVLYTRVFLVALPMWALLFGAGAYCAAVASCRALALPRRAQRPAVFAAVALVVAASAGELSAFFRWNRGLDLRAVALKARALAGEDDDAALIFAYDEPTDRVGVLNWEYYGFASTLVPYLQTRRDLDYDYLSRRRYVIAAPDEARARDVLARTRVDRFLAATLRPAGSAGALTLFEAALTPDVLAEYERAARGASGEDRAQALIGLGAEALGRGDVKRAEALLREAKALAPDDSRARFQLGLAYYLEGDPRAETELAWTVAHRPKNVHAPLYYADALADRGRLEEAQRWYKWYLRPDAPSESWFLEDRAKAAFDSLSGGEPPVKPDHSSPQRCYDTAVAYGKRGAFERASYSLSLIPAWRPLNEDEVELARLMLQMNLHRYPQSVAAAGPDRGKPLE